MGWPMRLFSTAILPAPCTSRSELDQIGRAHERASGRIAVAVAYTYDVAERDGIDEGGDAAWAGVVTGVVVGQQRRHLAHRLRQLRELLDGLHRLPRPRPSSPSPSPRAGSRRIGGSRCCCCCDGGGGGGDQGRGDAGLKSAWGWDGGGGTRDVGAVDLGETRTREERERWGQ